MVELRKCILLYDWLTFSAVDLTPADVLDWLGLDGCCWRDEPGSKLHYARRMVGEGFGITVHYSPPEDTRHNLGVAVEMSGSGCRFFEDHGRIGWDDLFQWLLECEYKITRLDVACDDFCGLIQLPVMAAAARRFEYTAQSRKVRIMEECDSGEPEHLAISVCHGSKSSEVYFRAYDKRAERHAWDVCAHWVRFEMQLRGSNCYGFLTARGSLGERFRGVVNNYLCYRVPGSDSNKARWAVAPWWRRFTRSAAAVSVNTKCGQEYNKDRLNAHIYERNHNSIATQILADGLPHFLRETFGRVDPSTMPTKYKDVLAGVDSSGALGDALSKPPTQTAFTLAEQLSAWADACGYNYEIREQPEKTG